jgi:hypothetical protein
VLALILSFRRYCKISSLFCLCSLSISGFQSSDGGGLSPVGGAQPSGGGGLSPLGGGTQPSGGGGLSPGGGPPLLFFFLSACSYFLSLPLGTAVSSPSSKGHAVTPSNDKRMRTSKVTRTMFFILII